EPPYARSKRWRAARSPLKSRNLRGPRWAASAMKKRGSAQRSMFLRARRPARGWSATRALRNYSSTGRREVPASSLELLASRKALMLRNDEHHKILQMLEREGTEENPRFRRRARRAVASAQPGR